MLLKKTLRQSVSTLFFSETFYWFGDNNYTEWEELFDQYQAPGYSLPYMTGVYSFGVAGLYILSA